MGEAVFTLKHLTESFLTHFGLLVRAGVRKPATLRWYTDQFRHLDQLAGFPADALRTYHLATIDLTNAFARAIKALFKWGAAEELIPRDYFTKLVVPPCGRRERVLERAELARLYRAAPRAFFRLLFVQLYTIARPGEVRNLTWCQVDWEQRCFVLTEFKGKGKRRDKLKVRAIPLPLVVVRLLRNLHRKAADTSPAARVFWSTRGKPWSANGVRCAMRRARERAGLHVGDEPVVCYHLRHTGATDALRNDAELKHLAEVMGHARTSTTERYVHLDTADLVGTIDRVHARRRANRAERDG